MNNILCIDTATHCGWCDSTSSGCWDFTVKKSKKNPQHPYSKLYNFKNTLEKYLDEHPEVDTIVSERVSGLFKNALISLGAMLGIVQLVCFERKLNHIEYVSTELKKWQTGKGNAKKFEMVKSVQDKYGVTATDDNQCDAIVLYYYHIYKTQNKIK